jgi:hypothetical protein
MNRAAREVFGVKGILVQSEREVAEAYGGTATPTAVLVSADGRIASSLLEGAESIRGFVTHLVTAAALASDRAIGASLN